MIAKFIAAAALAASLIAASAAAQTAAELMQRGIYTQETAGDADGAIQIYRQVIGSAGFPERWRLRRRRTSSAPCCKKETWPALASNSENWRGTTRTRRTW